MSDDKYNGWANYATWRIQLEIIDDYVSSQDDREMCDTDVGDLAEMLKEYVDEVLTGFGEHENLGLVLDYARSFVSDVDWYELARSAQETVDEMYPKDEDEDEDEDQEVTV
jgi:hypothetical protein